MFNLNKATIIIAEAGVNHNGDMELAKKLIDVASDSGVDFIKFQTFKSENLVTSNAKMADYQIENTGKKESQLEMLKRLELTEENFVELKKYCDDRKINFFSTAFDFESLVFLKSLNMGLWKIPSGEITNYPYLEFIGGCNGKVILSTGMSTLSEIKDAILVLTTSGTKKENIIVLHCNTDYPTKFGDVHLRAMLTIKNELGVEVGYSDHTLGTEVAVAAVAMGAKVIEKHFTLDKKLEGPDHKASLDPFELRTMVAQIRNIEESLGGYLKEPSPSELKNIKIARKSIVASCQIRKGEMLSTLNLTTKRPGTGINPMRWKEVIGKTAIRDFNKDELIVI